MGDEENTRCYECQYPLSEEDIERDKCPKCGRHYHDDQEDYGDAG